MQDLKALGYLTGRLCRMIGRGLARRLARVLRTLAHYPAAPHAASRAAVLRRAALVHAANETEQGPV